jgi:hypothetical protein
MMNPDLSRMFPDAAGVVAGDADMAAAEVADANKKNEK